MRLQQPKGTSYIWELPISSKGPLVSDSSVFAVAIYEDIRTMRELDYRGDSLLYRCRCHS